MNKHIQHKDLLISIESYAYNHGAVACGTFSVYSNGKNVWIADHYFNEDGGEVVYAGALGICLFGKPRKWSAKIKEGLTMRDLK